ncbi:cytochrome P450 3A9-like [Tubulanus polymorphus]|uniref:cytochrome P450 3A9-like n=1 Tax=Tubulanus polymorphus TaxID=672921 RepID=UPI003DA4D0D2
MDVFFGISVWVFGILLLLILLIYYYGYVKSPLHAIRANGIETPTGFQAFFGSGYKFMKMGLIEFDRFLYNESKDKKVIGNTFAGVPYIMISDLDMIKNIAIKDSASFINRNKFIMTDSSIMNKMLTMLDDDHWKHVRSMCTPTFSSGKMRKMNDMLQDGAKNLANNFGKFVDENKPITVKDAFGCYALDVTAATIFGLQVNSLENPKEPIVIHAKKLMQRFTDKSFAMILLFMSPKLFTTLVRLGVLSIFPKGTIEYFETVLDRALNDRRTDDDQSRADFLQTMAKSYVSDDVVDRESNKMKWSSNGLLREEILAQSFAFIFGGYENISNFMMYVAYCLALNPDAQDRLIKDIRDIIGNEAPDYDNVAKVEYLDMVINETSRLHTLASRIDRICNERTEMNGVVFEKGWIAIIPVGAIHMDPDIWPEPEKFDPERFSAENREGMHPCSFIPFGLGPRVCIAQRLALFEAKVGLATVLQNYRFVPCKETTIPLQKNSFGQPKSPIILKMEKIVFGEE